MDSKKKDTAGTIPSLTAQVGQIKDDLRIAELECHGLAEQLEEAVKNGQRLTEENLELSRRVLSLKEELRNANLKNKMLAAEVKEMATLCGNMEKNQDSFMNSFLGHIASLSAENQTLKEKLVQEIAKESKLREDLCDFQIFLNSSHENLKEMARQRDQAQEKVERLVKANANLTRLLRAKAQWMNLEKMPKGKPCRDCMEKTRSGCHARDKIERLTEKLKEEEMVSNGCKSLLVKMEDHAIAWKKKAEEFQERISIMSESLEENLKIQKRQKITIQNLGKELSTAKNKQEAYFLVIL